MHGCHLGEHRHPLSPSPLPLCNYYLTNCLQRDMRAVDVSFPNQLACFLVRDGAILINLEAFKAIVKHNCVILFTTEAARGTVLQQFCPFLQYRLTYVADTSAASAGRIAYFLLC